VLPTFALGFLDLIATELREASEGIASSHHLHNVESGIANILDLLEFDPAIAGAAEHLARMAANYINRHDLVSVVEQASQADADRLRAAVAALSAFRTTLDRGRPNLRVRRLRLG
jgi:hypothetical protein